jgi:hypothetical protein
MSTTGKSSDLDAEMGDLPQRNEICVESDQGACKRAAPNYLITELTWRVQARLTER